MTGDHLHDYDIDLCDYVLGNIVQHLHRSTSDSTEGRCRHFAAVLRELLTDKPLFDHVLKRADRNADAEQIRLLLHDGELGRLGLVFEDRDLDRPWEPYEALHRRYVGTLGEVRGGISRAAAERWSEECEGFARRLEGGGCRLSDGIAVVREWVGRLRHLLRGMGAVGLLPAPEGISPTPTNPTPARPAQSRPLIPTTASHPLSGEQEDGSLKGMLADTQALQREVRDLLVSQRTVKDFYTTAEVAGLLGRAEFTVREWCRNGRVRGLKQGRGRGKHQAWVIAHEELLRFQREGLLPAARPG